MFRSVFLFGACATLAVVPAAAATFTGPRAELRGGWDRTTISGRYVHFNPQSSVSAHASRSGVSLGLEAGYDAALGEGLIAGAYAGVEGSTAKDCSPVAGNDKACLKLGRNFTVGARVGMKVSSGAMLYVKGGYSNGQIRETYKNFDDPTFSFSQNWTRSGYHLGIGGEVAVGAQGYIRAELVRTYYKGFVYSDPYFRMTIDGRRDQALAGFGMRF